MKKETVEKPILFRPQMIKALCENRKTVTRRLLKKQPPKSIDYFDYVNQNRMCGMSVEVGYPLYDIKPIYWPGLKLWVREAWAVTAFWCQSDAFSSKEKKKEKLISVRYKADNFEDDFVNVGEKLYESLFIKSAWRNNALVLKWRPSIFIPRAAARFLLKITDVKIERLHELDDIDAILEGCKNRSDYARLWDEINGKSGYTWEKNPWVYRIQFERITP